MPHVLVVTNCIILFKDDIEGHSLPHTTSSRAQPWGMFGIDCLPLVAHFFLFELSEKFQHIERLLYPNRTSDKVGF